MAASSSNDTGDTTGDVVHLDANSLGAYPGDTLFGPGGSLHFSNIWNAGADPGIVLNLGSGADTIYAQPQPIARVLINANNPTASPGDTLNLALAAAENYVINPTSATAGNVTSDNFEQLDWTGIEESINLDDVAPTVDSADINLDGFAGFSDGSVSHRQSIDVQFSEDVSALLSPASIELFNQTTGDTISTAYIALDYDASSNVAHFTFPAYENGVLPDGNYHGRVIGGVVTDAYGNALPADAEFDFFFLQGDANHDGQVNLLDFNRLAANFNQSDRTFSQADFNYDGTVNLLDFNILAGRFNTALSARFSATAIGRGAARSDQPADSLLSDVLT